MEPANRSCDTADLSTIVPEMDATFKALGDLTRLQIMYLLATDTGGKLGVSELAVRLKISQPAVSQHLKTLRAVGLVESRRMVSTSITPSTATGSWSSASTSI